MDRYKDRLSFIAFVTNERNLDLPVWSTPLPHAVMSVTDATTSDDAATVRAEFAAQLRKWADRLDGHTPAPLTAPPPE